MLKLLTIVSALSALSIPALWLFGADTIWFAIAIVTLLLSSLATNRMRLTASITDAMLMTFLDDIMQQQNFSTDSKQVVYAQIIAILPKYEQFHTRLTDISPAQFKTAKRLLRRKLQAVFHSPL